jgi:hypothetical protein
MGATQANDIQADRTWDYRLAIGPAYGPIRTRMNSIRISSAEGPR